MGWGVWKEMYRKYYLYLYLCKTKLHWYICDEINRSQMFVNKISGNDPFISLGVILENILNIKLWHACMV